MFNKISFYIGNKRLTVNGRTFDLGELTSAFLNIKPEHFQEMQKQLKYAQELLKLCESPRPLCYWNRANEEYIKLDSMMKKYPCLRLLYDGNKILEETQELTKLTRVYNNFEPTKKDRELAAQIALYNLSQDNSEDFFIPEEIHIKNFGTENEIVEYSNPYGVPIEPAEKTPPLLITYGNLDDKWEFYKEYVKRYEQILVDFGSFVETIAHFIDDEITNMEKLNPSNFAKALYCFLNSPVAYKRVANPIRGTGIYTNTDFFELAYEQREISPGSGEFAIFECYTTQLVQFLLKADFYNALKVGYVIRRCIFCKRFFLLKKGYKTKYCDKAMSKHPEFTCSQMGYWKLDIKELAEDDPKTQSLIHCYMRIDKDYTRHIISSEEKTKLQKLARDLHHEAQKNPKIRFDKFEEMLQSKNLYKRAGVIRKTKPRGRPKKTNDEEVNL